MVLQLVVVIVIPLILGISYVPPFDLPEQPTEEITVLDEPASDLPDRDFIYFFLMIIWFFFLLRILLQIRKGTLTLKRKY